MLLISSFHVLECDSGIHKHLVNIYIYREREGESGRGILLKVDSLKVDLVASRSH